MHELGIVFHIIKEVKTIAIENEANHVSRVVLSVGEVSTVIPSYLTDCWKWAVQKEPLMAATPPPDATCTTPSGPTRPSANVPSYSACSLIVETIPAVTYCEACQKEYPTVAHGKICPHCGSNSTYLLRGSEVEIKEIEVS